MPTPTGLPKKGELWQLTIILHTKDRTQTGNTVFKVLERSRGNEWALKILPLSYNGEAVPPHQRRPKWLLTCNWWLSNGNLHQYKGICEVPDAR